MNPYKHTLIESIGTYLPARALSTADVLAGCKKPLRFPLERITGIQARRVVGSGEFSIDLARKAIADCLRMSKYEPADIDLLVCCNISRYDADNLLAFEPSTSIKLKRELGFEHALVFDLSNACAGMFTGVYLVDAFLRAGTIRRGMVVSGEYISHLTETAQHEIEGYLDDRMACLTLGDAGAAVILEQSEDEQLGFEEIQLQTYGGYSHYCIGKTSDQGGMIMHTDSVKLAQVAIKSGAKQAIELLEEKNWSFDTLQHLIMHQTSRRSIGGAKHEIARLLATDLNGSVNVINNLSQRGNTASTSHFVALSDQIRSGKVQSGDRVLFSISASGLTTGTALYELDDLPDRSRAASLAPVTKLNGRAKAGAATWQPDTAVGVRVESVGLLDERESLDGDTLRMLERAAANCLEQSTYRAADIDVVIYCGVYRSEYIMEPAFAALLAGKLGMNATIEANREDTTLAFDIFNGAVGFMDACCVVQQLMAIGKCRRALVVAAESENNAHNYPGELLGICETASAVLFDRSPAPDRGLSSFFFQDEVTAIDAYATGCELTEAPRLRIAKQPALETLFIDQITTAVTAFLDARGLVLAAIDRVYPPQISNAFIGKLSEALGIPLEKWVQAVGAGPDLFTSSFPYAWVAHQQAEPLSSETSLVIAVGSGIQVRCALYQS